MLNKEEMDILSKYPLFESIDVNDYIADFVMNNITNYPISASILSYVSVNNLKQLSRSIILDAIHKYRRDDLCSAFYNYKGFTNLITESISGSSCKKISFSIIKKDTKDITICFNFESNYVFIFNTDYDILVCTRKDNLFNIFNFLNINKNSKITDLQKIMNIYEFKTIYNYIKKKTKIEEFYDRYEMIHRYLLGKSCMRIKDLDPLEKRNILILFSGGTIIDNISLNNPYYLRECQEKKSIAFQDTIPNNIFQNKDISYQLK